MNKAPPILDILAAAEKSAEAPAARKLAGLKTILMASMTRKKDDDR